MTGTPASPGWQQWDAAADAAAQPMASRLARIRTPDKLPLITPTVSPHTPPRDSSVFNLNHKWNNLFAILDYKQCIVNIFKKTLILVASGNG